MSICPINYFVAKSSASSFAATVQSHYPLFSIDFMMRVTPCMRWFFEQNTDEGITFFDYILFYRPLGKQQDRIRRVEQESRILFHWIPSSYVYLKPDLEERDNWRANLSKVQIVGSSHDDCLSVGLCATEHFHYATWCERFINQDWINFLLNQSWKNEHFNAISEVNVTSQCSYSNF